MPVIAILGKDTSAIAEVMQSPDVNFILSDRNVLSQRYLAKRGYRQVTLYCQGPPKVNLGNFKIRTEFCCSTEVDEALRQDADTVI